MRGLLFHGVTLISCLLAQACTRTAPVSESVEGDSNPAAARTPSHHAVTRVVEPALSPCEPASLGLDAASPVPADRTQTPLGCHPRYATRDRDPEPALQRFLTDHPEGYLVRVVADRAALDAAYTCDVSNAVAALAFQRTRYVLLYEVAPDRTDYQVAFAVDDGRAIHLGYQDASPCSGVRQRMVALGTTFLLPRSDRPVILHRCAPRSAPCGKVP